MSWSGPHPPGSDHGTGSSGRQQQHELPAGFPGRRAQSASNAHEASSFSPPHVLQLRNEQGHVMATVDAGGPVASQLAEQIPTKKFPALPFAARRPGARHSGGGRTEVKQEAKEEAKLEDDLGSMGDHRPHVSVELLDAPEAKGKTTEEASRPEHASSPAAADLDDEDLYGTESDYEEDDEDGDEEVEAELLRAALALSLESRDNTTSPAAADTGGAGHAEEEDGDGTDEDDLYGTDSEAEEDAAPGRAVAKEEDNGDDDSLYGTEDDEA